VVSPSEKMPHGPDAAILYIHNTVSRLYDLDDPNHLQIFLNIKDENKLMLVWAKFNFRSFLVTRYNCGQLKHSIRNGPRITDSDSLILYTLST
jgi:hypothetical protein